MWDPQICIQCAKCVIVCPHAVIRSKVYEPDRLKEVPETFKSHDARLPEWKGLKFSLQVAGCGDQFGEHIYVTTMVPRPKPAPDVYLLAAEKLGAAPADCIVIEDSPAGAAAALGAGMRAIGYAPGKSFDAMRKSGARVIRTMNELIPAIDS